MDKTLSKKIHFHFSAQPFSLRDRTGLKYFIEKIFIREKHDLQALNFIFCNNKEIRVLNKEYAGHDYPTDILTFYFTKKRESIISDIFISQEQVSVNAKRFNNSFKNELLRVIFHGVLHLCGYNDKTAKEKRAMRAQEEYYLDSYLSK